MAGGRAAPRRRLARGTRRGPHAGFVRNQGETLGGYVALAAQQGLGAGLPAGAVSAALAGRVRAAIVHSEAPPPPPPPSLPY